MVAERKKPGAGPLSEREGTMNSGLLAHRENCQKPPRPELFSAAVARGPRMGRLEQLVWAWGSVGTAILDSRSVGVFWALMFICSRAARPAARRVGLWSRFSKRLQEVEHWRLGGSHAERTQTTAAHVLERNAQLGSFLAARLQSRLIFFHIVMS